MNVKKVIVGIGGLLMACLIGLAVWGAWLVIEVVRTLQRMS